MTVLIDIQQPAQFPSEAAFRRQPLARISAPH